MLLGAVTARHLRLSGSRLEHASTPKVHIITIKHLAHLHTYMQASESDAKPEELNYAKMDCTEDGKATCKRFGVEGFPTLKYLSKG